MDNKNVKELSEKLKEIEYIRLNFLNKLRSLKFEQKSIIKKVIKKLDESKIKKIREEINI